MTRINKSLAFTIVELVIVAPIVILVIGTFILAAVTMTGDVMATRASNLLTFNIQDTLNRIQNEARVSNALSPSYSYIYSPQSDDDIQNSINDGKALTLSVYGMTADPTASISDVALPYRPTQAMTGFGCIDSSGQNIGIFNIVYFKKSDGALWRRVIGDNPCDDYPAWPKPSCPADKMNLGSYDIQGYRPTTVTFHVCQSTDLKLVDGVTDFSLTYHSDTSATIKITAKQTIAGREINQSGTITIYSAK